MTAATAGLLVAVATLVLTLLGIVWKGATIAGEMHAGLAELAHERRHSINAVCLGLIEREIAKSEAAAKAMKDRQQAEKGKAV